MSYAAWMLKIALTWTPPHSDPDPPESRNARLEVATVSAAEALDNAAMVGFIPAGERDLWAAVIMVVLERESGSLHSRVHTGAARGPAGSICFMQIHHLNTPAIPLTGWLSLAGIDPAASRRCAWAGVSSLARARQRCLERVPARDLILATLRVYLRGHGCRKPLREAARRDRMIRRLLRQFPPENSATVARH